MIRLKRAVKSGVGVYKNRVSCSFFLVFFLLFTSQGFSFYLHRHVTPLFSSLEPVTITEENSGMESIDCIYVINLDKRPERLASFQEKCSERGLHANRVRGVDGMLLSFAQVKKLTGSYPIYMRPGQIGCMLSHLTVYKDAYQRGFSQVWIFEDDVVMKMDVNLIPPLLKALTELDPEWDIFYTDLDSRATKGGYWIPDHIESRPDQPNKPRSFFTARRKISDDFRKIHSRWGLYSYILSRRGIEKLYNYFSHVYMFTPIDADIHLIPGIRQYTATKEIVTNPRSDVSDTR